MGKTAEKEEEKPLTQSQQVWRSLESALRRIFKERVDGDTKCLKGISKSEYMGYHKYV